LLLIGALALLFSVAVLLESGSSVKSPEALSTVEVPSELAPGVSKVSTEVVEPRSNKNPSAIIDGNLAAVPRREGKSASIEELLGEPQNCNTPSPVIEAQPTAANATNAKPKEPASADSVTPQKENGPKTYTVEKNDSFWSIAKKVYGDGSKWKKIYEANRDICPRPDDVKPGLKLTIPEEKENIVGNISSSGNGGDNNSSPSTAVALDPDASNEPVPGKYYIVQKNDVLSTIAKKAYGKASLWRKILEANKEILTDEWSVRAGMKILIPRVSD